MSDFYLTLPSNAASFVTNTTGEFRINLPHPIELYGHWEVALASITYPNTVYNIQTEAFHVTLHSGDDIEVTVPSGHFDTIGELLEVLNYCFAKQTFAYYGVGIHASTKFRDPSVIDVLTRPVIGKILLPSPPSPPPQPITPPPDLDVSLVSAGLSFSYNNFLKQVELHINDHIVKSVQLPEQLQYVLGFKQNNFTRPVTEAGYPPDITGGISVVYVYTNVIAPQIVGDIETSLLRIVPLEGHWGQTVMKEFSTFHYVDLLTKSFSSVHVSLKSDTGSPLLFVYGKSILKLHFRRKKYLH